MKRINKHLSKLVFAVQFFCAAIFWRHSVSKLYMKYLEKKNIKVETIWLYFLSEDLWLQKQRTTKCEMPK